MWWFILLRLPYCKFLIRAEQLCYLEDYCVLFFVTFVLFAPSCDDFSCFGTELVVTWPLGIGFTFTPVEISASVE